MALDRRKNSFPTWRIGNLGMVYLGKFVTPITLNKGTFQRGDPLLLITGPYGT